MQDHEDTRATDVAWAAGIFEGEGWFGPRGKTAAQMVVGMTDRDIIDRFTSIVGVGSVTHERRRDPHLDVFRWSVSTRDDVLAVIAMFRPWLGARRTARADELCLRLRANRGASATRTHCPHGHEYTPENTYSNGSAGRQCQTCRRARAREQSRAKRAAARA